MGAAVAMALLLTAGLALVLDEHFENASDRSLVHDAWAAPAGAAAGHPGIWMIPAGTRNGDRLSRAPTAVRAIRPASLSAGFSTHILGGQELAVWTGDKDGTAVSAVYVVPAEENQDRLLRWLGYVSLAGIMGAALAGAFIGRRAVQPLVDAMAIQRHFVTDVSHELRTPLTAMQLRAQMLLQKSGTHSDDERATQLGLLVNETKAMADVVTDLLMSAQQEHRKETGEPLALQQIAQDVVNSLQTIAEQRSVVLTTTNTTCAATGHDGPVVVGAAGAVRRAILGLVDNALDHTPPGGQVEVGVGWRGDHAAVSVRDAGEGLDSAQVQRLAGRFIRGTTAHPSRRFGLGLALIRDVAQRHNGRLEVAQDPGHGACFTLVLPVTKETRS